MAKLPIPDALMFALVTFAAIGGLVSAYEAGKAKGRKEMQQRNKERER